MAFKTKVNLRFRRPNNVMHPTPDSEVAIMKKELSKMKKDLLEKQKRLGQSEEWSDNPALIKQLKDLNLRKSMSRSEIIREWNRLYNLTKSNWTSIRGRVQTRNEEIKTFKRLGFKDVNKYNVAKLNSFMDYVRHRYGVHFLTSDQMAEIYFEAGGDNIDSDQLQQKFNEWVQTHADIL